MFCVGRGITPRLTQIKKGGQFVKNTKSKKILSITIDILLIIVILIAIVISILTFSSKASNNGIANIMGYSPFAVQSDSMSGTFEKGDLIISRTKEVDATAIKLGDIITFYTKDIPTGHVFVNSHRVVKVERISENSNYVFFTTKGDNLDQNDLNRVGSSEVIGIYTGKKIAKLGAVMDFLQTQTGFLVCVLVPLALFFIWQLYNLFVILSERKQKKIDTANISDEDKKRIAEEYLKNSDNEQ